MTLWLLKDLGWVLLLCPLSWPAAFLALCVESHSLHSQWHTKTLPVRMHEVATLLWLAGNATWMTCEFLFEPSRPEEHGRSFPWYSGPLAGDGSEQSYEIGVHVAQAIFAAGLALLALVYMHEAAKYVRSVSTDHTSALETEPPAASRSGPPLVFGLITPELFQWLFIGPWILKDLFWTCDNIVGGLACGVFVALLFIDYIRRFGGLLHVAEFCWVIGNSFWIVAEIPFQEQSRAIRIEAAAIMGFGAAVATCALVWDMETFTKKGEPRETSPLLR